MRRRFIPLGSLLLTLLGALAACSGDDGDVPDAGASDAGAADTSPGRGGLDASEAAASSRDAGDATAPSPDASDSSSPDDAGDASVLPDGEVPDAGPDAGDAGPPPTGTRLAAGKVTLKGVTSDGYVAYVVGDTLNVAPLAGGPAATLTGLFEWIYADNSRPGVVAHLTVGNADALYAWTAANGFRQIAPVGRASSARALSSDGSLIAYAAGDKSSPQSIAHPSSLTVAKTDGTDAVGLGSLDVTCGDPVASFAANGALSVGSCGESLDGGPIRNPFSVFVGPAFTRTLSVPGAYQVEMDPTGRWLWSSKQLWDTTTGAAVFSDPTANEMPYGMFDATGEHVFYFRSDGALLELDTAARAPTVLMPSGCQQIDGLSPDGTQILCRTQGPNGSVAIVGLATGTAAPPWPVFTAGTVPSSQFTSDSREVLLQSGTDVYAVPAKGGASHLVLSGAYTPPRVRSLRGSRLLAATAGSNEVRVYDALGVAPAFSLASSVTGWSITADLGTVAYVVTGAYAGLYVASLP